MKDIVGIGGRGQQVFIMFLADELASDLLVLTSLLLGSPEPTQQKGYPY